MNSNQKKLPSQEQPWKKYHRQTPIREFNVHQKLDQMIEEANCKNLHYNALNFMGIKGNQWTYKELFKMRNQLADAWRKHGIKEDESVYVATVSGPEEPLTLLSLNRIGAVSKWADITFSAREFEEGINKDHCKTVIAFAAALPELSKAIDHTDVERVLVVEPSQYMRPFKIARKSFAGVKKMISMKQEADKNPLPEMPSDPRYMKFSDFVKTGSKKADVTSVSYDKERPVLKIQSSGTTGKPKSIVHTDFSINNSIKKFTYMDWPLYEKYVLLKTAPAWVGYGLINTLGVGLAHGMEVLMTPLLGDDILLNYNNLYDVTFAVPLHYRYLNAHLNEISDLSRPQACISGGDKIAKSELVEYHKNFATKGFNAQIINGAGNNEMCGAGYANPLYANKLGTVGIPMDGDVTSIFDPDTLEELSYYEEGELCTKTDSAFACYDNNPEQTKLVKRVHPDGSEWLHSNDLAKMDEEGYISLTGRLSRVISVGAFKISASEIEEVAQEHAAVKEAVVVAVPDEEQ